MAYPGRGDWTLKEMGLQRGSTAEDYGLYTPDFITYGTRYAESTPEGEGTQSYLLYEDSGNANQQDFLKSKCFLNAIDSKMSTVYKAETIREWMNGNKEKEDVKGLINRMWKLSAGDANTSPSLVVGGIMTVNPVTILYKTGRSVFSKNDLEPPPGQTPEEYETVVSNLLIENAIKINILFNLLQDFKEVNPNDPQPIPPNLKIEIGGHTDKVGVRSNFDNISLSKKRAEGIVNFLKSKSPELTSFCSPIKVKDLLTPRLKPKGYGFEECTTGNDVRNDGARKVSFRIVASDD